MTHNDRPLDDIAACLADMDNDIALLAQEGHPTTHLKRSIAGMRRRLDASTAIQRNRINKVPAPESNDQ